MKYYLCDCGCVFPNPASVLDICHKDSMTCVITPSYEIPEFEARVRLAVQKGEMRQQKKHYCPTCRRTLERHGLYWFCAMCRRWFERKELMASESTEKAKG